MPTGNITMYVDDNGTIKKINVPDTLSSHDVFPADILRDDVKNYTIKSIEPYIPADFKFGANPVSYTHLDVYKRQERTCTART